MIQGPVPRVLLDGFPRTVPQAQALEATAHINLVINLEIPDQTIIERISNRWIHLPSGRTYADDYNPPREKGKDDVSGEPLVQREDDKAVTVMARLSAYKLVSTPLTHYFRTKGTLVNFAGTESNIIYCQVRAVLEDIFGPR